MTLPAKSTKYKWAILVIVLAAIVIAAGIGHDRSSLQEGIEISSSTLKNGTVPLNPVTSFWADTSHIVCCYQEIRDSHWFRQCKVYEYPSGHNWPLPALDCNSDYLGNPANTEWEYLGPSKDGKRLFFSSSEIWYDAQMPVWTGQIEGAPMQWNLFKFPGDMKQIIHMSQSEQADETPDTIPVRDRFVGAQSLSISPDGSQTAWIDDNIPPEQLHSQRQFLRKLHLLGAQLINTLWIGDRAGKHARRMAIFGKTTLDSYDLRWSPDGKHLSCFSEFQFSSASNLTQISTEYHLTVFDAPR